MLGNPLEKCIMLKEHIIQLIIDGTIILDLDNVVEINHISCQTKGLSFIQFESLELAVPYEHVLPNPAMKEGFSLLSVFDTLAVNMASCSEVEEEIGEANGRQENFLAKIDNILAALEAIPVRLNWGQIFSLPDEMRKDMAAAMKTRYCQGQFGHPQRQWRTSSQQGDHNACPWCRNLF